VKCGQIEGLSILDEGMRTRYLLAMTTEQLIADAMALPLAERVSLAQALWESIDTGLPDTDELAAVNEAIQRDEELSSGKVTGRTHEEVMQAARRALECD
jgi:putative addiction module component (TIGR02574 family)